MLSAPEIYLYRESVDFRKSINGLAAIIENDTDLPLGSGALFLFTNKQRDKVKVLYWDKTGFALWYKRLEKAKYKWLHISEHSDQSFRDYPITHFR
nr:IS66 family insertion sequence element accessory protein TnpB [Vibrio parahaemolyticus]